MQMAESQPVPIDSLNSILVYLDIERRSYEDHKDDRQFDHVFRHATKVREWLSSLDMSKAIHRHWFTQLVLSGGGHSSSSSLIG
jgi:hypothetical protein